MDVKSVRQQSTKGWYVQDQCVKRIDVFFSLYRTMEKSVSCCCCQKVTFVGGNHDVAEASNATMMTDNLDIPTLNNLV
jgi:hypothetical protein